jgi:hypothetical protein
LARAFDHAAAEESFGNPPVARILLVEYVVGCNAWRKPPWADDFDPPGVLPYENGTGLAVIPVTHGVQDRFTNGPLVERSNSDVRGTPAAAAQATAGRRPAALAA